MTKLPDKPSMLLLYAVSSLAELKAQGRVVEDMDTWHRDLDDGRCAVCFAGAAALAAGLSRDDRFPGSLLADMLGEIDSMRQGYFDLVETPTAEEEQACGRATSVVRHAYDPSRGRATDAAYIEAAHILERAGL